MARKSRMPAHIVELNERLRRAPYSYDFYQAVRLLDCANHGTPATGLSETPKDDPFRFSQEPTLVFAPATLSDLEEATPYHPPRLVQRFFGLFGPQGPLPVHLTDYARSRIRHHDDPTFHRFLDIFHHRMLALFYRAWARVRPTVTLDRGVRDRFGEYVSAFFGLGMEALCQRDSLPDLAKRHYAGLFGCQTKHAEGLLSILKGYFGLPVGLEQFVGQWISLPEECVCRMGENPAISTLGESITVGSHVWDCQQKFRIQFGPLDLDDYFHMLPMTMRLLERSQQMPPGTETPEPLAEPSVEELAATESGPAEVADAIFYNGNFFTGDEHRPCVEAVAVRHGSTVATGSLDELRTLLDDDTLVQDLRGALVIPDLSLELAQLDRVEELASKTIELTESDHGPGCIERVG